MTKSGETGDNLAFSASSSGALHAISGEQYMNLSAIS
jgi:hypothetical protein